jgi:hypothetical protein
MKDEALKLALEALENCTTWHLTREQFDKNITAIKVIKQDLAAPVQEPVAYRQTGWAAHRDQYAVPVLFNPYTGQPRDVRDVQSDPQGILIVPPGKIEMLAAKPTHQQGLQVDAPPAAQRQWVGLTDEDFIDLCEEASNFGTGGLIRHIEAKLKEKNT